MILHQVYIRGFRNFKEVTVNFEKHSLIIGANDVGKSNLIYALRILLDRGFSDFDFEMSDSDFYAYEDTNEILIRAYLKDVTEGCVVARMPGLISDDHKLVLQFKASRNNSKTDYAFSCGKTDSDEDLKECGGPFYRKFLNLKYISSRRDFWGYINKSKNLLLTQAKENRDSETVEADNALYADIESKLSYVDNQIPNLSYVRNATDVINNELDKLSIHNREQRIVFDTSSTDIDRVISSVSIAAKHNEHKLIIGGEGRINQIYLSLWAAQNQQTDISNEVSIVCVEEPEAYLHPHQQRELSEYLGTTLQGQVLLTSHSPYIVSEFSPNSLIRLYKNNSNQTLAASNGCSKIIADSFEDFGYRMSVIPAETFFSDFVILVEGPSEMILYKTLAKQIGLDLDRLNISVMSVEGVGFTTYVQILNALDIKWAIRTDNDISQIPRTGGYRYAGIERGLSFLNLISIDPVDKTIVNSLEEKIRGFSDKSNIPNDVKNAASTLIEVLKKYNILIAAEGLEEDLFNGPINTNLKQYYGNDLSKDEVITKMKTKKAVNMYDFLKQQKNCLSSLASDRISLPLLIAKDYIESTYGAY